MNEDKRNFLFVSLSGLISDVAWQVSKEGHEVRYFIENPKERDIGDGFVSKVDDWEREVPWADVIVFDDTLGQGRRPSDCVARASWWWAATLYGPARGRSFLRPRRTQEGRHQHPPLPRIRQLRRRDRLCEAKSGTLRHQALGPRWHRQAASIRWR
jgi:phosphoribosylamine--glycine ligase